MKNDVFGIAAWPEHEKHTKTVSADKTLLGNFFRLDTFCLWGVHFGGGGTFLLCEYNFLGGYADFETLQKYLV